MWRASVWVVVWLAACGPGGGAESGTGTSTTTAATGSTDATATASPTGTGGSTAGPEEPWPTGQVQGCGLTPLAPFDARCVPWVLGCPEEPEGTFTPVIQIADCSFPGAKGACEPQVREFSCPAFDDTGFGVHGVTGSSAEFFGIYQVTTALNAEGGAALNWTISEAPLEGEEEFVAAGTEVLQGPCCETTFELYFPKADATTRVSVRMDWILPEGPIGGAEPLQYAPCPDGAGCPSADPLCMFDLSGNRQGPSDFSSDESHVCTRRCESDADCLAAAGPLPSRCLSFGRNLRACGRACADDPNGCPDEMRCTFPACAHNTCQCEGDGCLFCP